MSYCRLPAAQTYNIWYKEIHALWSWSPLHVCPGLLYADVPRQTCVVNKQFCDKLETIIYMTNHILSFSKWTSSLLCIQGMWVVFQIIMLFRHGTSVHFASAVNIISSCFPLFCHDHIPVTPILSVTVGVAEVCFCPVSYTEIDWRTSFLSECSLRGPKV